MVSYVIVSRWLMHWYLTYTPPSVRVWRFLGGSRCRAIAKTRLAAKKKYHRPRQYSPKEGCLRRSAINLAPPKRVKAHLQRVMRHTRPEPCSTQHGRPKCDPTTEKAHQHDDWCIGISHTPNQAYVCGTRPFLRWI